jgi:hypothetical protein
MVTGANIERWGPPSNMIVGEENYQPAIKKAAKRPRGGKVFRLVNVSLAPEPDNPVDAFAVSAHVGEATVGYLRAEVAEAIESSWTSTPGLPHLVVAGVLRGGGSGKSIGVHIWPRQRVVGGVMLPSGDQWAVRWPPHEWELLPRDEGGCWEEP